MASIQKRPTNKGRTVRWRVVWRQDGKQVPVTLDYHTEAKRLQGLVEACGECWPADEELTRYGFADLIERKVEWLAKHMPLTVASDSSAPQPAGAPEEPRPPAPAVDEMPTFAEYAEKQIARKRGVEGYTKRRYRSNLANHVVPYFGHMRVDVIEYEHMEAWQDAMEAKGLSRKTIANIRGGVIVPTFKAACAMQPGRKPPLIAGNPMDGLELPKGRKKKRDVITTEADIQLYLSCAYEVHPIGADLLMLGMATAMRWGELAGLRVRDIDLAAAELRPSQVLARGSENGDTWELRSYTKSIAGDDRCIPIPPAIVEMLRRLVAGKRLDDLVFTRPGGGPWDHAKFRERVYLPVLAKAQGRGLAKHITPHCLRHSLLTMLADQGVDPKVMQHMAGHESVKTLYDNYIHPTQAQRQAAAAAIGTLLPTFYTAA
ncbi:hypothetical protein Ait01nite_019690 [Actinoplanes italicus]|uniref:Site-specific recombinase XerD n=1 Tax=Actinoplanes italicus TaxID=113567 RepID=A0A2T0KPH4_9ACTN|nr:site-specific recombinase XerD [Actinoplanes italicus]GIE28924.1 hypothetical protein Ait01nite_019690 [Actinoplanes italicus]